MLMMFAFVSQASAFFCGSLFDAGPDPRFETSLTTYDLNEVPLQPTLTFVSTRPRSSVRLVDAQGEPVETTFTRMDKWATLTPVEPLIEGQVYTIHGSDFEDDEDIELVAIDQDIPSPAAVRGLRIEHKSKKEETFYRVSFDPVDDASAYEVQLSPDGSFQEPLTAMMIDTEDDLGTFKCWDTISNFDETNKDYVVRVRALNRDGDAGPWSDEQLARGCNTTPSALWFGLLMLPMAMRRGR